MPLTPRKRRKRYKFNALRIAQKLGIDPPKSWEEIWELLDSHTEPEYLYAIVGHAGGLVKFGRSVAPTSRLHQLQTGQGRQLKLYAFCPHASPFTEKEVHAKLKPFRETGEWFRRTPEVESVINAIRAHGIETYVHLAPRA